ncbi:MAG: hypothetical protein AB7U82_33615 [Blastocatellales bacterium]
MADVKIKVDTKAVEHLGNEFRAAGKVALLQLLKRGEQLLIAEMPERTGLLKGKKGNNSVSSEIHDGSDALRGELIVSAVNERRGARQATIHYPSGATKQVSLRPQPAFNYAEAVARGRKEIRPRQAKVLLIPVDNPPSNQAYVTSGNETFILRRRAKATKPNPYDLRAAARLEKEAPQIVDQVLARFGLLNR